MTMDDDAGEWHRRQAVECNNAVWALVNAERTAGNAEAMLQAAYASAYHWQRATRRGPENDVRAAYMLAKVQLLVGQPVLSLRYADACLAGCHEHCLADFDLTYALEARARALQALGRNDEAAYEWAAAKAVPIVDPEDQAIVDADLAEGP